MIQKRKKNPKCKKIFKSYKELLKLKLKWLRAKQQSLQSGYFVIYFSVGDRVAGMIKAK